MSTVSTHVLNTAIGKPAAGISVVLEAGDREGRWKQVGNGVTGSDGRITTFSKDEAALQPGVYRLKFDTSVLQPAFYPEIAVTFRIDDAAQHYHVPLLLSPFGYSTYRGS